MSEIPPDGGAPEPESPVIEPPEGEAPASGEAMPALTPPSEHLQALPEVVAATPRRQGRFRRTLARLVAGLWFGSGAFLLAVAAPAAFRASDTPTNAANVVGSMLTSWHYLGLGLPLVLLALEWRRARTSMIAVVFAAIMFSAVAATIDLRIRSIRANSPIPISSLDRSDPVRRHFGLLHGISSLLLLAQIVAAGAALAVDTER